jgi:hypothetical protein
MRYLGNIEDGVQVFEISFQLFDEIRCKICIREVAANHRASNQTLGNSGSTSEGIGTSTAKSDGKYFWQSKIVQKLLNILDKINVTALGLVRAEAITWAVNTNKKDAMDESRLRIEIALKTAAKKPMKVPVIEIEKR